MGRDIYHNKKDFARQEFATELPPYVQEKRKPREAHSQKSQIRSGHVPEKRNDLHTPMKEKQR